MLLTRSEAALLRGWAQGLPLNVLALQYFDARSRAETRREIERLRAALVTHAQQHGQPALAQALGSTTLDWPRRTAAVLAALLRVERLGPPQPRLQDAPGQWLPPHLAKKLARAPLATLGALFELLEQGGYYWWRSIPKLGATTARAIVQWLHAQREGLGQDVPADVLKKPPRSRLPRRVQAVVGAGAGREGGAGKALALVPLDRFSYARVAADAAAPAEGVAQGAAGTTAAPHEPLDGTHGKNRAPPVSPQGEAFAANDYEAIQRWLATVADRPNTYRTYRKEAERLLLWAVYQRGKALSSLDLTDCVGYRDFLAALDPDSGVAWVGRLSREDWIGPRNAPRGQSPWRPFAGPLSPRSQLHALTIVQALFQFLVGQGYLWRNPFAAVKGRTAVSMAVKVSHAFNAAQWQYILAFLESERAALADLGAGRAAARAAAYARTRFVVYLGYGTGLRLAELTAATLGDLQREAGEGLDDFYWVLRVVGKGNKPRVVPLPDRVAEELVTYLRVRGLPPDLQDCDLDLPLIERLRRDEYEVAANGLAKTTLAPSSVYRSLKLFFGRCAVALEGEGNSVAAERLRAASTHWLRHTHGTLGVRAGIRQSTIRDSLGHASIATTGIYLNDDLLERKREMEKLFGAGDGMPS